MYNRWSARLLRWLKVPPEPHPPFGDPASLRVFRAGRNYYRLRLFGWGVAQVFAFAGIVFWAGMFIHIEETARHEKARRAAVAQVTAAERAGAAQQAAAVATDKTEVKPAAPAARKSPARKRNRYTGWDGFVQGMVEIALRLPPWAFPILWVLKAGGLALYLLQLPVTYAVRRLDYEMRWYVVTDRSLRIRTGVWSVQEITMSFANLQQVEVSQGPLQRLLGLADVMVQSAGGSGPAAGSHGHGTADSLHTGHFHGVENASEIRDLIQDRLRRYRESGLGDPEELRRAGLTGGPPESVTVAASGEADVLAAARELAAEAKALRVALN